MHVISKFVLTVSINKEIALGFLLYPQESKTSTRGFTTNHSTEPTELNRLGWLKIPEMVDKNKMKHNRLKDKRDNILVCSWKYFTIITLLGDLRYTRHLAADSGSTKSFSVVEDSLSSIFFDKISLDPLKHPFWFWSEVLGEKIPRGVCTTSTESGFGTLRWN